MIYIRKLLLPVLIFCLPKMAIAQSTPPIDDKNSPYLVVFTTGDDTQLDKYLESCVQSPRDVVLREIVDACRIRVVDSKKPSSVYKTRYEQSIERSRLPAIVFTEPDGGVLYVADKTTLPPNEAALAREIQFFADAAESAQPLSGTPWINSNEKGIMQYSEDCPDGVCPVPVAPNDSQAEQRKPLFPRLRNSGEPRNIMDNWFSTNNIGIHPTTFVVILALILLAIFMRGGDNGRA